MENKDKFINNLHSCFVSLLCSANGMKNVWSIEFIYVRNSKQQEHLHTNRSFYLNKGNNNFFLVRFSVAVIIIIIIIGTDVCFPNYRKTGCYALLETTKNVMNLFQAFFYFKSYDFEYQ